MRALLPYLPLLACPLMMLVCMWAMRGHGRSQPRAPQGQADAAPGALEARRIAQLEREVAGLQAQLDQAAQTQDVAGGRVGWGPRAGSAAAAARPARPRPA
jgi:hypothetical protein